MIKTSLRTAVICGMLSAASLALPTSAMAKLKVIESDVPGIEVGSEWPDDANLPIPPGKSIRVLVLPANTTRILRGPEPESRSKPPWGGTRSPTLRD